MQGGEAPGAGEPLGANGSTRSDASARSHLSTRFNLSTSWRNGHDILAIANALVGPLRPETRVPVEKLQPGPVASRFAVDVDYHETVRDEAGAAAAWLAERLAEGVAATGTPPTAAMLFRTRSTQSWFIAALREASIPFHVLGVGGLMAEPEIADLVSALRVVHDPSAGSELIRLLAGSRWRIGVRDLRALSRVASWLRDRDYGQHPYEDAVKERLRASVVDGEGGSIIDALDFVATARPGHSQLEGFSADGLDRLRHAGGTFTRLRARGGLDLLDYVTLVVQELQLDIEVAANDHRTLGGANLEALFDALNGYLAVDDSASLGGFLSWLKEAEWRDGLAPRPEDAEPGTVQLLTVHGSKGLEWDLVVVPRWVEDELPGKPLEGSGGWLTFGALPWAFRGDAAELPEFAWEEAETRKEVVDAKAEFVEKVQHHHVMEERRLGYVAVTRARHRLLLSGSYWATQTSPRRPSAFLRELQAGGLVGEVPEIEESESNPLGDGVTTLSWPLDPLGGRRSTIETAAEAVGAADPAHSGPWRETLDLLLAERANRLGVAASTAPPTRIPASRFKDFVTDPTAVRASLRRPMPERPYRATRLGTLFHDWVEARYEVSGTAEELDSLGDLGGEPEDDRGAIERGELARLQQVFGRSRWATRTPVEVEREIHLILDGQIIVCKIDAIYFDDDRYEVVDWKTGKAPKNAQDLEDKQLQLALYRLAFARWKNIDPESIDAVFFYVSDDTIIRPARIFEESELVALWRASL